MTSNSEETYIFKFMAQVKDFLDSADHGRGLSERTTLMLVFDERKDLEFFRAWLTVKLTKFLKNSPIDAEGILRGDFRIATIRLKLIARPKVI